MHVFQHTDEQKAHRFDGLFAEFGLITSVTPDYAGCPRSSTQMHVFPLGVTFVPLGVSDILCAADRGRKARLGELIYEGVLV